MKARSIAYFLSLSIQTQLYLSSAYTDISRLLECIFYNNTKKQKGNNVSHWWHFHAWPIFRLQQPPKIFFGVRLWLWPVKLENFLLLFYVSRDLLESLCIFIPPLAYNL